MSSMRAYETFYGIHVDDWSINWGTFTGQNKILTKDYISDGCDCTETSSTTLNDGEIYFLYPHHLAKTYFIEGVIEGQITIGSNIEAAYICAYRVTIGKMHEDGTDTTLFTTQWITVNKELEWDSEYEVGEEIVLPFWIDAWSKAKLDEFERIYVKVEITTSIDSSFENCSQVTSPCYAILWHSNDATWEDIKITIPFMGL